jgi:hypothetical protein
MSIPAGYQDVNPAKNVTLNYAAAVAKILGNLDLIVTATAVLTGVGTTDTVANVYVTPAAAEAAGVEPATDKIYLVFEIQGVQGWQEVAVIGSQLAQGNVVALAALFQALFPYGNPAQQAVNAALDIPSVAAALKAELQSAVKA